MHYFFSNWMMILFFTTRELRLQDICHLCRLQRVSPICKRSFLLTQSLCSGSFQSGGVLLSSHLKDNHNEILFAALHVNGSLSKGTGCFYSARQTRHSPEKCCRVAAPPPPCTRTSHPSKHTLYHHKRKEPFK